MRFAQVAELKITASKLMEIASTAKYSYNIMQVSKQVTRHRARCVASRQGTSRRDKAQGKSQTGLKASHRAQCTSRRDRARRVATGHVISRQGSRHVTGLKARRVATKHVASRQLGEIAPMYCRLVCWLFGPAALLCWPLWLDAFFHR